MKLLIFVKKWFDKANGNTYHSIQFDIKNTIFFSGRKYGYGTQYKQTLKEFDGFCIDDVQFNIDEYDVSYIVIDANKKSDLEQIHQYS